MALKKKDISLVKEYDNNWEFRYPVRKSNEAMYDKYYDAVELLDCDDALAETEFKKLVTKHPFLIDGWVHLSIAYRNQGKLFESMLVAEKAYNIGKQCFPDSFVLGEDKLPWRMIDNRPFLRSCQVLGLMYAKQKKYDQAIEVYKEILLLNDQDNQGVRYLLLETYLSTKKWNEAWELIEDNSDDANIVFVYGRLLVAIILGKYEDIETLVSDAKATNLHLWHAIINQNMARPDTYNPFSDYSYEFHSEDEAYDYWIHNSKLLSMQEIVYFCSSFTTKSQLLS